MLTNAEALDYGHRAITELEKVTFNGLPKVYGGNVREFLSDFWPDLPWDIEESKQVFALILANPTQMKVVDEFDKRFGLDKPLPMGAPNEDGIRFGFENPEDE